MSRGPTPPARSMSKQADLQHWQHLAEEELGSERALLAGVETPEGILRKPLYTQADLEPLLEAARDLGEQ